MRVVQLLYSTLDDPLGQIDPLEGYEKPLQHVTPSGTSSPDFPSPAPSTPALAKLENPNPHMRWLHLRIRLPQLSTKHNCLLLSWGSLMHMHDGHTCTLHL